MLIKGIEVSNDDVIVFKTINPMDQQSYTGRFKGVVGFEVARLLPHLDVVSYHRQVMSINNTLESYTRLEYLIIEDENGKLIPCAIDWVEDGSLRMLSANTGEYRVFGITPELEEELMSAIRHIGLHVVKIK
jgi:hypothetical protein